MTASLLGTPLVRLEAGCEKRRRQDFTIALSENTERLPNLFFPMFGKYGALVFQSLEKISRPFSLDMADPSVMIPIGTMAEQLWFYSKAGSGLQTGPLPDSEIRARLASGELAPADLVWREGWSGWVRVDQTPELSPPASNGAPAGTPPPGMLGWMKLVGVTGLVLGIGSCLTCFGLLTGIPMIIGSSAFLSARAALARAPRVPGTLQPFLQHLKLAVQMLAWIILLALLTLILSVGFYLGLTTGILRSLMAGARGS